MLKHSTVESVEARQPTWLAVFETILSIAIYAFIAWRYQTYVHFVVAAVFAPLFLLRTKESTGWLHAAHEKSIKNLDFPQPQQNADGLARLLLGMIYLFFCVLLVVTFVLRALLLRFFSTFYWLFSRPFASARAIPGNWFEQAFCVDIFFLPEMVPGENARRKNEQNDNYQMLLGCLELLRDLSKEKDRHFIEYPATLLMILPIFIAYAFSLFYRIGFKATSVFYFPLVWVSNSGLNDDRPVYERLARFGAGELEKARRTLSLVIAPVVALKIAVMLGFADLKAAVEKLVESSWFVFLKPLLEQFLNPGFMAWWIAAVAIEIVLTYALFYFADEALARKDGAKPWPERRVATISSALITLRSTVAVLLVCSGVVFLVSTYLKAV